jgi:hypothetical protein
LGPELLCGFQLGSEPSTSIPIGKPGRLLKSHAWRDRRSPPHLPVYLGTWANI